MPIFDTCTPLARASDTGKRSLLLSVVACTFPRQAPPDSFKKLIENAAEATAAAIADGSMQMEVEFPPVPTSKLDDSSLSAYDILEANLRLVVEYHKRLLPLLPSVNKVALTLPDLPERKRAVEFLGDEEPWPGLRAWSLVGGDAQLWRRIFIARSN